MNYKIGSWNMRNLGDAASDSADRDLDTIWIMRFCRTVRTVRCLCSLPRTQRHWSNHMQKWQML